MIADLVKALNHVSIEARVGVHLELVHGLDHVQSAEMRSLLRCLANAMTNPELPGIEAELTAACFAIFTAHSGGCRPGHLADPLWPTRLDEDSEIWAVLAGTVYSCAVEAWSQWLRWQAEIDTLTGGAVA